MIMLVITNQIKFGWLLLFGKQIVYWIFHIFFNEVICGHDMFLNSYQVVHTQKNERLHGNNISISEAKLYILSTREQFSAKMFLMLVLF